MIFKVDWDRIEISLITGGWKMIGLSIVDIKTFMAGILTGNMFEKFYLRDGEIQTFTEFRMGGYLNHSYYDL